MTTLKTFRVTFIDTRCMRIDLRARSAAAAIKAAKKLYLEGPADDNRFIHFGGDAFDNAHAEELKP